MMAKLRTNFVGGSRMTRIVLLMFPSGHIMWLVTICYCLGFALALRAMMT